MQYTRKEAGDGGTAVPYPLVTVCTSGAAYTPLPCTPKASIYSDAALTVPLANPFRGDMFGNIEFYATPAAYIVSVTAPYSPGYSFKMSPTGGFAGSIASTQVAFGSAVNTIAGDANFTWNNTNKSLTVTNSGVGGFAPIYALALGVVTNEAGIVAQCQQLANAFCEAGQFVASDLGAGPIGSVIGIAAVPGHAASGTLATMTGVDVTPSVSGGAGAITTSRGIHVAGVAFPTGTSPTTHNGIIIDDQCAGSFPAATCIGLNIAAQSNSGVAASINGPLNACILNGMYVAGSSCYATIQAAETAACAATPDGTVYIPATYAGTDTFTYSTTCSAGYPSVDDKRRSASSGSAVYSITYPSTDNMSRSLPLGADMSLYTAGSSDLHIKHGLVAATTTAALGIGANNNILVSSVTCPNCITALPFTGTANLYIGASLIIGRETANEENVSSGNWSIVDATHLNITCAKVHAGTTDVEQQMGSTFFDGGSEFIINPKAPAQSTHGSAARFFDGNGNLVFFYPGNSSDAWPYNGLQIFPSLTGALNSGVSSPDDLKLRNSSASFCTKMVNSVGNGNIALFCDTLVTITKNTSFFGGGNTIFYSDQGVTPQVQITGTTGTASFNGRVTTPGVYSNLGNACTNGELALSAGWQSTGSATVTAVAGIGQTCSWTITTGTTTGANPTVTDTLVNALPVATIVCEINIHGGTHTAAAGEGFTQTSLSATAPIFTFIGTPTAGGTTYFVTRRCGP